MGLLRDSMSRALRVAGIPVVSQHSEPDSFLSGLKENPPEVAIVDLLALSHDAFEILAEAHQFHPDVRILALLPEADASSVERCLQAGAAGYLDKRASDCDALISAIFALARGDRVFPSLFLETFVRTRTHSSPSSGLLHALSNRERQVLSYLANGTDNGTIAHALKISERTVKAHVSSLYRKLHQQNRTQLALLARQLGVRPPVESLSQPS
jgi:DNA-binding NarL/FixJ family response regulator